MAEKGNTITMVCDTTKETRLQEMIMSYTYLTDIKEREVVNFLEN